MMDVVNRSVQGSSLADLIWLDDAGEPHGCGVSPLLWDGKPAVAFTYNRADLARQAGNSKVAAMVLTETRSTGSSFAPAALYGRPTLIEDPAGELFTERLLAQELRRYPPARVFADSPLLQREHWWYLPRLILVLDVDAARPMPARPMPVPPVPGQPGAPPGSDAGTEPLARFGHLLGVAVDGRIEPRVVTAEENGSGSLALAAVDGRIIPRGPAVLLGQEATFPDLSEWATWRYTGLCTGERLEVVERPASVGLGAPPSIWERWRRQRAFSRACRAGIAGARQHLRAER
jgi:hypothetical protein